ncbi:hypothetical protein V7S43_000221 [Phytophthora oleae]|uniref:Uncharacterized protein n=1 Tax=Phytophthora oleae TaxID=2107226 RepID=A0ABD3G535_9STRA
MASRARSASSAAASSTRTAPEDHSSLLAGLRATAGIRATKSRLARAAAVTSPPPGRRLPATVSPAAVSPAVSPPLSPAVLPVASPNGSTDGFSNRLRELRFDALLGISDAGEDDVSSESDASMVARPASPSESASSFFDDDEPSSPGGADDPTAKRRRLLRGDTAPVWHPALPKAPEKHPYTNRRNHYDPTAPWDYDKKVNIKRLLDRHGDLATWCSGRVGHSN